MPTSSTPGPSGTSQTPPQPTPPSTDYPRTLLVWYILQAYQPAATLLAYVKKHAAALDADEVLRRLTLAEESIERWRRSIDASLLACYPPGTQIPHFSAADLRPSTRRKKR